MEIHNRNAARRTNGTANGNNATTQMTAACCQFNIEHLARATIAVAPVVACL
jgi:hypothetical protein